MKNFSILLISCFAVFQLASADTKNAKECLIENGFKETDVNLLASIGRINFEDVVKDEHREKLACVLACIFRKENEGDSLHEALKDLLAEDTKKAENLRKEMSETLSTCKAQAGDDDCKLLQCVKITQAPFYDILYMFAVARDLQACFVENGLQASDALEFDKSSDAEGLGDILKKVDEDKLACAMTCLYSKQDNMQPNETLQGRFETKINTSDKVTADQKKEMLETLKKCGTEAAGDNCKLVKCIKILRGPFLQVYH